MGYFLSWSSPGRGGGPHAVRWRGVCAGLGAPSTRLRLVPLPVPGRMKKGAEANSRAPFFRLEVPLRGEALRRGLQHFLAFLPVAGAQLVGLKRVEDAQSLLRVAADVEAVHRNVLDDVVRIDDERRAIGDSGVRGDDSERAGQLLLIVR